MAEYKHIAQEQFLRTQLQLIKSTDLVSLFRNVHRCDDRRNLKPYEYGQHRHKRPVKFDHKSAAPSHECDQKQISRTLKVGGPYPPRKLEPSPPLTRGACPTQISMNEI